MLSAQRSPGAARRRPRESRLGISLLELIIVLAILGIAAMAVGRIGVGQQSHYREFAGRMRARSILREGSTLLTSELRGISPGAGDLYEAEMRDASIAFRSTVGAFVLCEAVTPGSPSIDVTELRAGDTVSAAEQPSPSSPSAGDSVWLYDSGRDIDAADDRWVSFLITSVTGVRRTCTSAAPAAERDAFRLTLSAAVHAVTEAHAPLRLFRRVRYALYAASDGLWYLGFSDCRPVVRDPPCAPLQPIAGPYASYSAASGGARSGLVLSYLDRDGRTTADPSAVALIGLVLRVRSIDGGRFESDAVERRTIALRNATP
jgi:prepilin-type N-terminal cleavage/methylation domain-containing protein